MTTSFENCEAGTFYGWDSDSNNEFHPGDTVLLQWGTLDNESTPLNLSLSRLGGTLVGDILEGAVFSTGGSIYRTTNFSSSNCTLDQYNWTIPLSFNTTDPTYQLGLFNASTLRGTDGNNLWGFLGWSAIFHVEPIATTTTTAGKTTATATKTNVDNNPATMTTSSTSTSQTPSSSAGLSGGAKAGIGVGVTFGALALVGLLIFIFFRRKKASGYTNPETQILPVEMGATTEYRATRQVSEVHEMDGVGATERRELDGGNIH
ncbi:hypothetical protein PISL3812_09703 [Talaromyces islandicus]|uniref:Peptidase A1 domain-containing protein n=1 Tax=Talaromyces islandicus TaxID=28573 RepID=A0A0U1MCC3_TALIS|nr:hypothetical protein PISL3812_09703 [Talaromyces islandicus]